MTLTAYLGFNGNCDEAFKFYEKCLGGKIVFRMTMGDSPMAAEMPPQAHNQIMHVRLAVDNGVLMGSDGPADRHCIPNGSMTVSIGVTDPAEADRVYNALGEGGTQTMPLQETFWAKRFGMLVDKFGVHWMVNCEKPMSASS